MCLSALAVLQNSCVLILPLNVHKSMRAYLLFDCVGLASLASSLTTGLVVVFPHQIPPRSDTLQVPLTLSPFCFVHRRRRHRFHLCVLIMCFPPRWRKAVCSTSNDKAVTNLVKTLMGKDRLDRIKIFAGDIVERKKPHPDVYNLAKVRGLRQACSAYFVCLQREVCSSIHPCTSILYYMR